MEIHSEKLTFSCENVDEKYFFLCFDEKDLIFFKAALLFCYVFSLTLDL